MTETKSNPFPGPRPFTPDEYRMFAGRNYEISEICSLIVAHQVVVLYGQSGAGKTSLLNAGIFPALREKDFHVFSASRVGIPVPQSVELGQIVNVYMYSAVREFFADLSSQDKWLQNVTLAEALARVPRKIDNAGESVLRLVTFDQFEELFSKYPERWQDRRKFFEQVHEALLADSALRVLFGFREDYLAVFDDCSDLLPENGHTRYRLERLREPEALEAITRPLDGTQWSFDVGVAETIVSNLMQVPVEDSSRAIKTVTGEFVEPVQLQVVCYNLFDRLPPAKTKITKDDLAEFGDPDEALERFYQDAIEEAAVQSHIEEAELRSWFEKYLITAAGTRGLVYQDQKGGTTGGIPNEVVRRLEDRHLIRPEVRSGARWYELSHDRFVVPIRKSNRAWQVVAEKVRRMERIGSMARKVAALWFILLALVWSTLLEVIPVQNQISIERLNLLDTRIKSLDHMLEREITRIEYYKRIRPDKAMYENIDKAFRHNDRKTLEGIAKSLEEKRLQTIKEIKSSRNPPFTRKEIRELSAATKESLVVETQASLESKSLKRKEWIAHGLDYLNSERIPFVSYTSPRSVYINLYLPVAWLIACASLVLFLAYNTMIIKRSYVNICEAVKATSPRPGFAANDRHDNPCWIEPMVRLDCKIHSFSRSDASIRHRAYLRGPLALSVVGFLCVVVIAARVSWLASEVSDPLVTPNISLYRFCWVVPIVVIASSFVAWCCLTYKAFQMRLGPISKHEHQTMAV